MRQFAILPWKGTVLLLILFVLLAGGCNPGPVIPTAIPPSPYMAMNPPPDSDKPLPVPSGDNSCWMHTASNILAGAGYGNGTTVQDRADDIFADMNAQYGTTNGGWIDAALQWWLGSANNTWTTNSYTVVTVYGNKTLTPWANTNGARTIGNELRSEDMVGLSISWPTTGGGHAITAWGDDVNSPAQLTTNPGGVRVADSDTDSGGDVQAYTYDTYTNPNPGGSNAGNGWYFNYGTNHPYIKHIATLSPTSGVNGVNTVHVVGSYQIQQTSAKDATDLHYQVATDVDVLTYRTWIDWEGTPTIVEDSPRRGLTVDWIFTPKTVPQGSTVTISTEFVEPSWNSIHYSNVYFTYSDSAGYRFPDLQWTIMTPRLEKPEAIPNVTGGYVIGSFDVLDPKAPDSAPIHYRLVHEYLYNQSPESHTFTLIGPPGVVISNVQFGHSYGYPSTEELWRFENWMTKGGEQYTLSEKPLEITIDWKGLLPYPQGDR